MPRHPLRNVGNADRIIRFLLGFVLLGFAAFCPYAHSLGMVVTVGSGLIGLILMVTALRRICPLYRLLGIHS